MYLLWGDLGSARISTNVCHRINHQFPRRIFCWVLASRGWLWKSFRLLHQSTPTWVHMIWWVIGRWTKSSPLIIGIHHSSLSAGVKVCRQLLCSQSVACSPGLQRSSGKLGSRGRDKQKGATVSHRSCSLTRLSFLHSRVTFLFEERNDRKNGF